MLQVFQDMTAEDPVKPLLFQLMEQCDGCNPCPCGDVPAELGRLQHVRFGSLRNFQKIGSDAAAELEYALTYLDPVKVDEIGKTRPCVTEFLVVQELRVTLAVIFIPGIINHGRPTLDTEWTNPLCVHTLS
jgi:hypothetical protein